MTYLLAQLRHNREMRQSLSVGDSVRYFQVGTGRYGAGGGWRFGRIIGRHSDTIGINPSGLEMATVRFPALNKEFPECDWALPLFVLEAIGGVE